MLLRQAYRVTPFVGVWIETMKNVCLDIRNGVTPFVGVWIETHITGDIIPNMQVTPFVGVWIETKQQSYRIW